MARDAILAPIPVSTTSATWQLSIGWSRVLVPVAGPELPFDRLDQPAAADLGRPALPESRRIGVRARRARTTEAQVFAHLAQACRVGRGPPVVHASIAARACDRLRPCAAPGGLRMHASLPVRRDRRDGPLE